MDNQFMEFLRKLFDTSDFPARWNCGQWSDFHGWFYIIGDLMVWSAYFAIPIILLGYVFKRKDVRFHRIYILFAAFILFCGASHLIDAAIFWIPMYRLSALLLFITGVVSWTTVFYLIKLAPVALSLKTVEGLEAEVDSRIKAEEELKNKLRQLNEAQALARMGSWEWEVATNKLSWSDELFNVYDLPISSGISFEDFMGFIHPEDKNFVGDTIKQALMEKMFPDFYHRIVTPKGNVKTLQAKGNIIFDSAGEIVKIVGTGQDVTDQKRGEQALVNKSRELQEANKELQKFAYVASHDLQEPLRKIKTFISLLEIRMASIYEDDETCNGYLKKMDASTSRMQNLMHDILNISRISSATVEFENIDLNAVVDDVLVDMEIAILSSQAKITVQHLPKITACESQWRQLFQNLISNAIKYAKHGSVPFIDISSKIIKGDALPTDSPLKSRYKFKEWDENYYWALEKFCSITVMDKGIGIDPEYYTKIFEAFQRLHTLNQYEGTGIGLAICKKIVDYHNGIIYVNSTPDGTFFTIVVPISQDNFEGMQLNQ